MGAVGETVEPPRRYSAAAGAKNAKSDYNNDNESRKRRA